MPVVPVVDDRKRQHPHRSTATAPDLLDESDRPMRRRTRLLISALAATVLVLGSTTAITAAMTAGALLRPEASTDQTATDGQSATDAAVTAPLAAPPVPAQAIPAPSIAGTAALTDPCGSAAFTTALESGDDAAALAAMGGAEAFRGAVAAGAAPCLRLDEPGRVWTVVNKTRAYAPVDYAPSGVQLPEGVRSLEGEQLRADAASALTALGQAAIAEGAGEIALESGYRSYDTQRRNFGSGGAEVEASVARPGYSEHQSGLAADVVACGAEGCGSMDDLAASAQGAWIAANAWRFGWIVRYEEGRTGVTGYIPEPWHLRYIGIDLAAAYHGGGWHTLEEFFGLPAAPNY